MEQNEESTQHDSDNNGKNRSLTDYDKKQQSDKSDNSSILSWFFIAVIIDLVSYFYHRDEIVEYFEKSNSIFAYIAIHPWAHILFLAIIFAVLYQIIQYTSDKNKL